MRAKKPTPPCPVCSTDEEAIIYSVTNHCANPACNWWYCRRCRHIWQPKFWRRYRSPTGKAQRRLIDMRVAEA